MLRLISRLALTIEGQPVKPGSATPPMASRFRVFGLELPCSPRVDRLRRCGRGVICSQHDCRLQLGGPVCVGQSVVGCRSVFRLGLLLHWLVPPVVFVPLHAHRRIHISGRVTHFVFGVLPGWLAWFGVLAIWRVRQLSRGCVGDDLACPDPLGTSRWSRLFFKERRGAAPSPCCRWRWSKYELSVQIESSTKSTYFIFCIGMAV